MATTITLPKTYAEANPLDVDVQAMRWLLTAIVLRQSLYHYLRELTDEHGQPGDIRAGIAEEIARYTTRRVARAEGFTSQETDFINGQLDHIEKLRLKAYPVFPS